MYQYLILYGSIIGTKKSGQDFVLKASANEIGNYFVKVEPENLNTNQYLKKILLLK